MVPRVAIRLTSWLAAIAAIGLSACTNIRTESGQPITANGTDFAIGRTTLAEVLSVMGPPGKLSVVPGGLAMIYEHTRTSENQFGISFGTIFQSTNISRRGTRSDGMNPVAYGPLDYLDLVYSRGEGRFTELVLFFDKRKVLTAISKSQRDRDLGSTIGARLTIFPDKLLSTGKYHRPAAQHRWGFGTLAPLPRGLNRMQDLNSGAHGFEQRGTPSRVGQRTLEWNRQPY